LVRLPVPRVVPWRWLAHKSVLVGLGAAAVAALLLAASERARSGAWALFHPGERDAAGVPVAAVIGDVQLRLVYPGYLARPPVELTNPFAVEAPRGTTVELSAEPRIAVTGGILHIGERRVRLSLDDSDRLAGRFVVRDDAELTVRVRAEDGRWFLDPGRRALRAIVDEAPRVAVTEPLEDVTIELREELFIAWEASDDVGLTSVDLVVRMPDGQEVRRSLDRWEEVAEAVAAGTTSLLGAALGASPGDQLSVMVVARDGDEVSGPNEGRSDALIVTIASEATRRAQQIEDLSAVLDTGLDALADRLEREVPATAAESRSRFDALAPGHARFADGLTALADSSRGAGGGEPGLFREMARRVRRVVARDRRVISATASRRTAVDAEAVEELERDALLLADLVGRARIDDAAAIARELEDIRRQMASLIAELRRADTPEARRELAAAIARARARMRDLAERLAAMAGRVPSDFVNADSIPQEQARDALDRMEQAIDADDLDEADRMMAELQRQIDQIASLLGGGAESFGESRFGPRDRAMAEALDALAGLEAEQRELHRRTEDVRRDAAQRALSSTGDRNGEAARRLARRAADARQALDAIQRGGPVDVEAFERARQRLTDVEDALSTGDLGEARRMAEEATNDVEDIARDLDLSALMFPGADGETGRAARSARQAAEELRDLRRDIDRAIPRVGDFVGESGREQLREDARRQRRASAAAEDLAERFAEGPGGAPLSPDATEALERTREAMGRGVHALDRGDPIDGAREQEDAARRLTELREQLERDMRGGQSGRGDRSADGQPDFREPVRIPGADEFEGPREQRRRLLDAMREVAPSGYEDAVRRYYRELLR
jgi:hypothetical protein